MEDSSFEFVDLSQANFFNADPPRFEIEDHEAFTNAAMLISEYRPSSLGGEMIDAVEAAKSRLSPYEEVIFAQRVSDAYKQTDPEQRPFHQHFLRNQRASALSANDAREHELRTVRIEFDQCENLNLNWYDIYGLIQFQMRKATEVEELAPIFDQSWVISRILESSLPCHARKLLRKTDRDRLAALSRHIELPQLPELKWIDLSDSKSVFNQVSAGGEVEVILGDKVSIYGFNALSCSAEPPECWDIIFELVRTSDFELDRNFGVVSHGGTSERYSGICGARIPVTVINFRATVEAFGERLLDFSGDRVLIRIVR